MPAGKTRRVPTYRLHKASGRGVVTLNGRDIFLGKHGTIESRQRYARLIAEWTASGGQERITADDITIAELALRFWTHAEAFYRKPDGTTAREIDNYRQALRPLKALYADTLAKDFGPRGLRAVQGEMIKLGWCRNLINRQTSRLKAVFKWATADELIPPAVYHAIIAVDGIRRGRQGVRESKRVTPIDESHIEAIRPWLSRQVQAMIDLQLLTGARPTEICTIRRSDIDATGDVWIYRPVTHKTAHHGHAREIRIGPKARAILQPFFKPDLSAYLFSPIDAESERHALLRAERETRVQPSQIRRGQLSKRRRRARAPKDHYDKASYRRAIARACDRADEWLKGGRVIGNDERIVPRWHPHQLRHNAATNWRRKFGPDAALQLLGDRNTRMIDVYAERDARTAEQAIAEVG